MTTSLADLVARCIEALERGDRGVIEQVCTEHPEHAVAIRRQLARLDDSGFLGDVTEIPDRVGPYRTIRALGRGGMGSVYLAEQTLPVRRQVALKVIKLGMDSREVLARFERERQALAMMSHPHIATVFDAGLTAQGRPYFAMEYVPGEPITTFCVRRELSTSTRLQLLAQVCDAVQHAHHKGVIHRDLKPSNVLVMERDGVAVAKVIDFGVAKAIVDDASDARTGQGQIVGTPEYMSPEQAGRSDVDSRTDVYALGVLLYELLTGLLPFEPSRLRHSDDELRRIIGEEAPPTPSSRVSTQGSAGQETPRPRAQRLLRRRLRGELDWITLKALAKDRDDRYPTPRDLAEDLRRHLLDEPVRAGPPSAWYRVRKFARRYRIPVTASVAVLVALVGGLATSLVFYGQARESARRAGASEADALDVVRQMLTRVGDERLADLPHTERVRRELLQDALRFYRKFLVDRQGDEALRLEVADAHTRVARILGWLGEHSAAQAEYRQAIAEMSRLRPDRKQRSALAHAKVGLANVQRELDPDDQTEALLRQAAAEFVSLRANGEPDSGSLIGEAAAQYGLGYLLMRSKPLLAHTAFEAAVALAAQVKDATGARDDRLRWAMYRVDLADCLDYNGVQDLALDELRAARAEVEALLEIHPGELDLRIALARNCQKLALLAARHREGGAPLDDDVQTALSIREALAREFPSVPEHRVSIAVLSTLQAHALFQRKQFDAADAMFRSAVAMWETLVQQFPDVSQHRLRLAGTLYEFGHANLTLKRFGSQRPMVEVEAVLRRSVEEYRRLLRDEPQVVAHRQGTAGACELLAELLVDGERYDEAAVLVDEEVPLWRGLVAEDGDVSVYHRWLSFGLRLQGRIRQAQGDHDAAERVLRESLASLQNAIARGGPDSWRQALAPIYELLGKSVLAQGQVHAAAAAARATIDAAPQDAFVREGVVRLLLDCHRAAIDLSQPELARTCAQQAVADAGATLVMWEEAQAATGMSKFFNRRAVTALLLAHAQFAAADPVAARASARQAAMHANAAWQDKTTGFGADRLRAFYAQAVDVLRQNDAADLAAEFSGDLLRALGEDN